MINKTKSILKSNFPIILASNNDITIRKEVNRILDLVKTRPHVFNVGHGLTPNAKIDNVKLVINLVKNS